MAPSRLLFALTAVGACSSPQVHTQESSPNRATEPFAERFSLGKAVAFVDGAALRWQSQYRCVTCHTNGLYLVARPQVSSTVPAYREVREFARGYLKRYVVDKEKQSGQHGSLEGVVATTCFLAVSDMRTNGRLDAITKRGLDHMWKMQDESGAFTDWLKCKWPPFEVDDHFGATLAVIAAGAAPRSYRRTPVAKKGIEKLLAYLRAHPPDNEGPQLRQDGLPPGRGPP